MPERSKRQLQIGEEIRRLTARSINELINTNINNDFLTIMKAEISKDLRYCKIFFRCKIENQIEYQKHLNKIVPSLTNLIYKQLRLRIRPEIHFVFDDTMFIINEIENLMINHHDEIKNYENEG